MKDKKSKKIFAIESSCDEISFSIINDKYEDLITKTFSQEKIHSKYGGVVPEIASREHLRSFLYLLEDIFEYLNFNIDEISYVAITIGPGLSGSLMIGLQIAKVISIFFNKPLIPVHHILGHAYSVLFNNKIKYPYLSLVVSGGHTELLYFKTYKEVEVLGRTQDDAVGELYDKISKRLGFNYPGGPLIDEMSYFGEKIYNLKTAKLQNRFDFSYSGIKTQLINLINNTKIKDAKFKYNISRSLQAYVIDDLISHICLAIENKHINTVSITGGVSSNSLLRSEILKLKDIYENIFFILPNKKYTTDNASMIGAAAFNLEPIYNIDIKKKLEIVPNYKIEDFFEKYQNIKEEK